MSRVACVWADLPENTETWYENTHIPNVVAKLNIAARNAEQVKDNIFKEVAGIQGRYMTLYDVPAAVENVAQIQPEIEDGLKDARMETRIYDEFATWHGDEWCGHTQDVRMFIVVLWQPVSAIHDDFVEWFRTDFAPGMLESPELLRTRIFKLQQASVLQNGQMKEKNINSMFNYMTVWEFDCEDLPWEILVYLGSSERWRYYVEGGHVQWQIAQFLVNRTYPEDESTDSPETKRATICIHGGTEGQEEQGDDDR